MEAGSADIEMPQGNTNNFGVSFGAEKKPQAPARDFTVKKFTSQEVEAIELELSLPSCCPGEYEDDEGNIITYDMPSYGGVSPTTGEVLKCYAEYFPYYIEMGKYEDNTPIRWLIIGTDNNGEIKALTVQDHEELEQGKLTEEKQYYVLSEKALEGSTFDADSNEYATSDIRAYLTSEEFTTKYSITQADLDKIQARSLQQMYEKDTISYRTEYYDEEIGEYFDGQYEIEITRTLPAGYENANDKFWLLSLSEMLEISGLNYVECPDDYYRVLYNSITTGNNIDSEINWWLRTDFAADDDTQRVCFMYIGGGYSCTDVSNRFTIRPAFKI
jgi:hypothetical protein